MEKEKLYNPLPEGLRIQKSEIQGFGLFTLLFLKKDTNLGISHVKIKDELIRTPLGGFVNHSDDPNCEKIKLNDKDYIKYNLVTIKDIEGGEELTVKYTFYNVGSNGKNFTVSEKSQAELEPIVNAPMMDKE
jgi:hypothetical protein